MAGLLALGCVTATLYAAESGRVKKTETPEAPATKSDAEGPRGIPEEKKPPGWTPWLAKGAKWLERRQRTGPEAHRENGGKVRVSGSQLLAALRFVAEVDEPFVPPTWVPEVELDLNQASIREAEAQVQRVRVGWEDAGVQLSHQWAETDVEERITAIEFQWKW